MVRRITKDLHTRCVLEDLLCDSQCQVPLHRKCLPECGPTLSHTRDIQTTFVYRLFPWLHGPAVHPLGLRPSRFPSGGGGGSASFSKFASLSVLEDDDTSARSTLDLGSRTLSIMRQFVADVAEVDTDYEKGTDERVSELNVKGSHQVKDTRTDQRHATLNKDAIKALRKLIEEFEDQLQCPNEGCEDTTSDEGQEEDPLPGTTVNTIALVPDDEENDEVPVLKEPQLYLCDDWIQPMAAMSKPRDLTAKKKDESQCGQELSHCYPDVFRDWVWFHFGALSARR